MLCDVEIQKWIQLVKLFRNILVLLLVKGKGKLFFPQPGGAKRYWKGGCRRHRRAPTKTKSILEGNMHLFFW